MDFSREFNVILGSEDHAAYGFWFNFLEDPHHAWVSNFYFGSKEREFGDGFLLLDV